MNRLQNIPADDIPDRLIHDDTVFRHPVFDTAAFAAQAELAAIQGRNRTWFAGAWTRSGFHEDGFASAVRIAGAMERQPA